VSCLNRRPLKLRIPTRAVEGVNSSMIYLIHCKNLYKCYNVSPPSTTIKKEKEYQLLLSPHILDQKGTQKIYLPSWCHARNLAKIGLDSRSLYFALFTRCFPHSVGGAVGCVISSLLWCKWSELFSRDTLYVGQ
jgi:hypothetical protein